MRRQGRIADILTMLSDLFEHNRQWADGWIFSLDDGLLRNLERSADGAGDATKAGRCSCHLIDKGQ